MKSRFNRQNYGDEDRYGATARVLWTPTDAFSTDLFYYYSKIKRKWRRIDLRPAKSWSNF